MGSNERIYNAGSNRYYKNMPSVEYWAERMKDKDKKLYRLESAYAKDLKAEYKKALIKLDKEVRSWLSHVEDHTQAYKLNRLANLIGDIQGIVGDLSKTERQMLRESLYDAYRMGYDNVFDGVNRAYGTSISWGSVPRKDIKAAMNYAWSGEQFSDRIWENKRALIKRVKSQMKAGIIQGQSTQKIAYSISKYTQTEYKNAIRLARTEINYIQNQGTIEAYKEFGVEEYEYFAELDDRTSEVCMDLHKSKIKLSEAVAGVNAPPMHPNCRSTIIPIIKEDQVQKRAKK